MVSHASEPGAGHDGEVRTMRDVFVSVVVGALVIGALVLIMFLG
ncbi:MAG: hypothetical protein WCH20_10170 [Nitrospira sp.]